MACTEDIKTIGCETGGQTSDIRVNVWALDTYRMAVDRLRTGLARNTIGWGGITLLRTGIRLLGLQTGARGVGGGIRGSKTVVTSTLGGGTEGNMGTEMLVILGRGKGTSRWCTGTSTLGAATATVSTNVTFGRGIGMEEGKGSEVKEV